MRYAKDPIHARMVMPVLEGHNDTPATDDLFDVMKKLDVHMATQLMKAAASLPPLMLSSLAGTASSPLVFAADRIPPRWFATQP
jgi:hypothetical protein